MLVPPKQTPAEVEHRLAAIEDDIARRRGKLVGVISVGFIAFLPVLAWIGITDLPLVLTFTGAIAFNGAFAVALARRARAASVLELHVASFINAIVTVFLARVFTPFLLAPGIAAGSIMMYLSD